MLPSRVGTIDRNRPGTKGITFWERAVGVNRPYRRWVLLVWFLSVALSFLISEPQVDLQIDMHTSVLDLKTRVLSSQERTTIQRADFNIAGDSVYFDTNTRTGRLIGNVKMVITDQSHLTGKTSTNE